MINAIDFSRNSYNKYIQQFLDELSIKDLGNATQIEILAVLKEYFHFSTPQNETQLQFIFAKKLNLDNFLASIQDIILQKHPAIGELVKQLVEERKVAQVVFKLSKPQAVEFDKKVRHIVIFAAVLEELNLKIGEDFKFHLFLCDHLEKEVAKKFSSSSFMKMVKNFGFSTTLFIFLKRWLVNECIATYHAIRTSKRVSLSQRLRRKIGLFLNISEAILLDLVSGSKDNAYAGKVLALSSFDSLTYDDTSTKIIYSFSRGPDWMALYSIWNLTFVHRNLDNQEIVSTKMLIPSVLGALPNEYVFHRMTALHLIGCIEFLRYLNLANSDFGLSKNPLSDHINEIMEKISKNFAILYNNDENISSYQEEKRSTIEAA